MDFSLTDEQQLLLDSVDELMERYGTEQYFKECDEKHVWPQEFTDALLENGSWSVTSGREMKKILEPLKGWSEVSAPITVKSALREDQLAAIDALADARKKLDEEMAQRRDLITLRRHFDDSLPLLRATLLGSLLNGGVSAQRAMEGVKSGRSTRVLPSLSKNL